MMPDDKKIGSRLKKSQNDQNIFVCLNWCWVVCNPTKETLLSTTMLPKLLFCSPLTSPSECQQLIKWCLALRPSDRPSLEQIADHPWMRALSSLPVETPKPEGEDHRQPATGNIRLRTIDTDSLSSTRSSKESLWDLERAAHSQTWDSCWGGTVIWTEGM